MKEIAYLNGAFIPLAEAGIPVTNYGFLFGYGLFETMRAYDGHVFRLRHHLARLENAAVALAIAVETKTLERVVPEVIALNGLNTARVRITISAGEGSLTPDTQSCGKPTVLVTALAYRPPSPAAYAIGQVLITSSFTRYSRSPLATMKTANYLENMLARQEARNAGAADALLLNDRGMLAEATSSNFFLVKGGRLRTPGLGCGILPGITRATVLEIARRRGIDTDESQIAPEELSGAEEAFVTNTLIEIFPVVKIDGQPVGSGRPGRMTRILMRAYRDLVRSETGLVKSGPHRFRQPYISK